MCVFILIDLNLLRDPCTTKYEKTLLIYGSFSMGWLLVGPILFFILDEKVPNINKPKVIPSILSKNMGILFNLYKPNKR